jgi:hypothetical protein
MKQITLVSLYGQKRDDFAALIGKCQELVRNAANVRFTEYKLQQIHATILGLERKIGSKAYNANFFKFRGLDVPMDLDGLQQYLRYSGAFPVEVQIGGF